MSYILDALRKSEVERQRAAEQKENSAGIQSPRAPKYAANKRTPVLISVVILMAVSVAAFVVVQADKEPALKQVSNQPAADEARIQGVNSGVSAQQETTTSLASNTLKDFKDLPFFWEKSSAYRQGIDPFAVSIHVYSPEPSQRILFINNREYRAGEQTKQGPRVESIEPQGVILSYRGEYFKLPRPR